MNGLVKTLSEFEEGVLVGDAEFVGGSVGGEVFPADGHVLRRFVEGFGEDLVEKGEALGNLGRVGGAFAVDVGDEGLEFELGCVGERHGQVGGSTGDLDGGNIMDAFGTPCNATAWTKSDYR